MSRRRVTDEERTIIADLRLQGAAVVAIAAQLNRPVRTVQAALIAAGLTNLPRPSEAERFWSKVAVEGECWVWQGSKCHGYGNFRAGQQTVAAHRYAYEAMVAPIPEGLALDHLCRNPPCVNPDHLDPVPSRINSLRAPSSLASVCAARTECPQGHPYTPENTYLSPRRRRYCRRCQSAHNRNRSRGAA